MPELPDLLYINTYLEHNVRGRMIRAVDIQQPVVLRNSFAEPIAMLLAGSRVRGLGLRGPFLILSLSDLKDLILNLMLSGELHHTRPGEKLPGWRCVTLSLDDQTALHLTDEKKMAKLYLAQRGKTAHIPRFDSQGVDILSAEFTPELLQRLAGQNRRRQVRVFVNDQTVLSSIGNAYADEILFEARIHPKTLVASLSSDQITVLYGAIRHVMAEAIEAVAAAQQPIHRKVRDHLKVRNRKDEPCPRCGTTIRREGVRGYDVYFCPACQGATRRSFIEWRNVPGPSS